MKPNFSSRDACEEDDQGDHSERSETSDSGENQRATDWFVDFGRGWGPLKLGTTRDEVEEILAAEEIDFQRVTDRRIEINSPYAELSFDASEPPRLVDIYLESDESHRGHEVLDQPLAKAFELLGISSAHLHETLWSMVSGECEFDDQTGKRVDDSARPKMATTEELLKCSFLWLKSLGIGLSIFNAEVNGISIREPGHIPVVGCGPLTNEQLQLIHSRELEPFLVTAWSINPRRERLKVAVMIGLTVVPIIGYLLFGYRHLIMDLLR